jgi:hypothetical protein
VEHLVSVGVDVMTGKLVTMLMPGSPFQSCYAFPVENARALAHALLSPCDEVGQHDARMAQARPN